MQENKVVRKALCTYTLSQPVTQASEHQVYQARTIDACRSQWLNRARWVEDKQLDQEKDRDTSKQEDGGNVEDLQLVSVAAAAGGDDDDSYH